MAGNKNWSISLPSLAGIAPMDPTQTRLPTGAYKVRIADTEDRTSDSGTRSISCTVEVLEGEHRGVQTWVNLGLDLSKDGNKKAWVAFLKSLGANDQQIAAGINLTPASLANRQAYIFVKAAPEGEKGGYDNRNFITPEKYQQLLAQAQTVGGPAAAPQVGSAVPAGVPAAVPAMAQPPAMGVPQPAGTVAQLGAAIGTPPPAANGGVNF